MRVYGHPWSVNTRKVLMAFAEKGHEPDLVPIAIPNGEHLEPAHLARHPFGKVPVLEDGDVRVYESRAIVAYLDRVLPGPRLTPEDPAQAARVEQCIGVAEAYFAPSAGPVIVETTFRKYLGGEVQRDALERGRAGIEQPLDVLDGWLRERPYVAAEAFTRADLHWMPYVDFLSRAGEGRVERRERVASWWSRVRDRPTWKRVAETGPQP